jgi:cell division septal protein FtsQ
MKCSESPEDKSNTSGKLRILYQSWKEKRIKRVKNLKFMGVFVIFGLTMGVILAFLIFALWSVMAISFGVISGISLASPLCWMVGGLFSVGIVYAGLTQKN